MYRLRPNTIVIAFCAFFLAGCVTDSGSTSEGGIGPQSSSFFDNLTRASNDPELSVDPNRPKLDVIIPIFDPGLAKKGDESSNTAEDAEQEEGVWPELRRAESIRFANKLKNALDETNAFGAVRVTPDKTATGDLYILGRIEESNGEDVEISLRVFDISGKQWDSEKFEHTVTPAFYKNVRNKGKDPYDPVFNSAANHIVKLLTDEETAELTEIKRLTDLRFGASFVDKAFAEHLLVNDGRYRLAGFPSETDPMFVRTKAIRIRDQLFVDGLQDNFRSFSEKMNASYSIWQEQSLTERKARSAAQSKAAGEAALGVLAIGLSIAAIIAGGNSDSFGKSAAANTAGIVGGVVGAKLLTDSFQTAQETKVHRDALEELGRSIDSELAPTVVDFEKKSVELTGTAQQQFAQWRSFLKRIYLQERTPDVQL